MTYSIGISRVNGGLQTGSWIGRPQEFLSVNANVDLATNFGTVDSNAEKVMRAVEQYCTINMVGAASGNVVTFMIDSTTLEANVTVLASDINTATGGTGAVVTLLNLSGATLA